MYYDPEDSKEMLKEVNPIVQVPAINDHGFCLAERYSILILCIEEICDA